MRSCFALFFGASLLLCFPGAFSVSLAGTSLPHSDRAASIDRIGDIIETDSEEEDEDEFEAGDCGCEHGDADLTGSINEEEEEDEDKDYTNDERYA